MSTFIIQWEPQTTLHNQSKDIPANSKQLWARASSNALLTTTRTTNKFTKRRTHGHITLNRLTSYMANELHTLLVCELFISWPNLGFMPRRQESGYCSGWSKGYLSTVCQSLRKTDSMLPSHADKNIVHSPNPRYALRQHGCTFFFTQIQLLTCSIN